MRRRPTTMLVGILVAALCSTALRGAAAAPSAAAAPGRTADCPPAGGVKIRRAAAPTADFAVLGRGWGHGVGMSQYGAQGAARLGCDAGEILGHYYPGVAVRAARKASATPVRIGLTFGGSLNDNRARALNVTARAGDLPWFGCDAAAERCSQLGEQPVGRQWQVRAAGRGGFAVYHGERRVFAGRGTLQARMETSGGPRRVAHLATSTGHRYRWGRLEFRPTGSGHLFVTAVLPSAERYLRGLAEVPFSWPHETLRAQAIVARSYALDRVHNVGRSAACDCHLYDTPLHQVYAGFDQERTASGPLWAGAVAASRWQVMRYDSSGNGTVNNRDAIAVGFYSSSHGGASESSAFVWGGSIAYLQARDDSRWDQASDNPLRTWSAGFSARRLGAVFGVGRATGVERPAPRGLKGRVGDPRRGFGGVVVTGTRGSVRVSGEAFRAALGLRSTLFTVVRPARNTAAATSTPRASSGDASARPAPDASQLRRLATPR